MAEKKYLIGLDIGSTSIKIMKFAKREGAYFLEQVVFKEFQAAGKKNLCTGGFVECFSNIVKDVDIKNAEVCVGINCPNTALCRVTLPFVPKDEIGGAIELEAKNYFPFSTDNSVFEFEIIREFTEKNERKYDLLIAVSPKSTIDSVSSVLKASGISPKVIVPSTLGIRGFVRKFSIEEKEAVAFLDIGSSFAELLILKDSEVVFWRKLPVRGEDFTKALTTVIASDKGKIEVSLDEAENIKRKIGIPDAKNSVSEHTKIDNIRIMEMIRPYLEKLVDEVNRCFEYYNQENPDKEIAALVLLGRGSLLKRLPEIFERELDIKVKTGFFINDKIIVDEPLFLSSDNVDFSVFTALGLIFCDEKSINFLPKELQVSKKRDVNKVVLSCIGFAVLVILFLAYFNLQFHIVNVTKRIVLKSKEIEDLKLGLGDVDLAKSVKKVILGTPDWLVLFRELSIIVPEDICLMKLDFN
ncbi:MAG: pilus assembly protein PilM, partial [Candidatus Omnitrophota bacterium]